MTPFRLAKKTIVLVVSVTFMSLFASGCIEVPAPDTSTRAFRDSAEAARQLNITVIIDTVWAGETFIDY